MPLAFGPLLLVCAGCRAVLKSAPRMRKFCLALLLLAGVLRPAGKALPLRWFYPSRRLGSGQELEEIRQLARTASENGLNGVLPPVSTPLTCNRRITWLNKCGLPG